MREALGRVLAVDVVSQIDVPSHTNSAMDGYAFRREDAPESGDANFSLTVVDEIGAGHTSEHTLQAGEAIKISMKWHNTGSAPCYQPYRVAYRLSNNNGDTTKIVGLETVEKWMPGEIQLFTEDFFEQPADLPPGPINEVSETIRMPDDLKPGHYQLSIGVVGEKGAKPLVQLGIEGRSEDGWYSLSKIRVVRE